MCQLCRLLLQYNHLNPSLWVSVMVSVVSGVSRTCRVCSFVAHSNVRLTPSIVIFTFSLTFREHASPPHYLNLKYHSPEDMRSASQSDCPDKGRLPQKSLVGKQVALKRYLYLGLVNHRSGQHWHRCCHDGLGGRCQLMLLAR